MKKVGLVSFTDPRRSTAMFEEREEYVKKKHQEIISFLEKNEFNPVDPHLKIKSEGSEFFGISNLDEVEKCVEIFKSENVQVVVIGCWHWTEPGMVLDFVANLNLPFLLYTEDDPAWAGSTCISAVGATIWECAPTKFCRIHERIIGQPDEMLPFLQAMSAYANSLKLSALLWGGSYCLKMAHLEGDEPYLRHRLIGDIIQEDQYVLIKRADDILKNHGRRIKHYLNWLKANGTKIIFDDKMLTEESLNRQIALYIAAKDRLEELKGERIGGVSIRCQPELSEEYGVTACPIPALFPYPEDADGKKEIIPTVCEGDIKSLVSAMMLHQFNPKIPPNFGDLKYFGKDFMLLANCGSSSIYYAKNSLLAEKTLPKVTLEAQCQGVSGGAVGYRANPGQITMLRLIRVEDKHYFQMAVGESTPITEEMEAEIKWGKCWPHTAIKFGVSRELLCRIAASNHYVYTPGDFSREITYISKILKIPIMRLDSDEEIQKALEIISR